MVTVVCVSSGINLTGCARCAHGTCGGACPSGVCDDGGVKCIALFFLPVCASGEVARMELAAGRAPVALLRAAGVGGSGFGV